MKSKTPTKAQRRRFDIIKFEIGCLFHAGTPAEAHHLLSSGGGNRISHDHTVPLCPECHFRIHNEKRAFYRHWRINGEQITDESMLELTDRIVAMHEAKTTGALV